MTINIGTKLGPYEIVAAVGSGGMGAVYRALDTRLDRIAAIKVLREDLASDPDRLRRFEQEARSASALNHPNIITIYEIRLRQGYGGQAGKHEETPFIAMEYVEGQTLREILAGGPLPKEKLLHLATQMAEGLAKAHIAGIIHRDLKPENLMVTSDGYVKILDFGLAKLLPQSEADSKAATVTKEGTAVGAVIGTASYMSPEQARGKPLDARTDVFSLGSVLYEMATGRRPFVGETMVALFDELLHATPPSPSSLNPQVSRDLDNLVYKALEKDLTARYPSARELLADLETLSKEPAVPEASPLPSIVVLPFENISPDPEQEYFCDGMTEEITSDLAKVHSLRVISRTSAMRLKGTDKDIKTISKELSTRYVLEGSVRKAKNNLRITAQLIDATTDTHLWSEKYTGTVDDVFEIQEEVSRSIVDALKLKLQPEEDQKIADRPIENVQAYECFLRAKREMRRLTEDGITRAFRDLQIGLEIVGENPLLQMAMGEAYIWSYELGIKTDDTTLEKAKEHLQKGLKLAPDSSHSHYLLGMIDKNNRLLKAIPHFKKALAIEPNSPDALWALSVAYALQAGHASAGQPLADRLVEIDPLTPLNYLALGLVQWMNGRLDEALYSFERCAELEPDSILPQMWMVYLLTWMGQPQRALGLVDEITDLESSDLVHRNFSELLWFFKYASLGEKSKAEEVLSEGVKNYIWADTELRWLGAGFYALMNEKDEALRWLEHAINAGWINYPLFAEQDPFLENIRGEERFKRLMERVKYEWEHFEV